MDLPPDAWRRPDPALLRLRRVECLVAVGLPLATASVAVGATRGAVPALATLMVGAALLALVLTGVQRRFAAWAYLERDDDLVVRRGVVVRRTTVVPYGRMQYVDVVAGPLDRRYGIATVVLHTAAAATDATVPGLRHEDAERLRDSLAALGEARAAGV